MASGSGAAPAAAAAQAPLSPTALTVTAEAIRSAVQELLQGKDLLAISLGELREKVSQKLGFTSDAFDPRKREFKKITSDVVNAILQELGASPIFDWM